jgi:hypothetical protein
MVDPKEIQKAREILGKDADGMTDAQVGELIALVEGLADIIIDTYIAERRPGSNQQTNMAQRAA